MIRHFVQVAEGTTNSWRSRIHKSMSFPLNERACEIPQRLLEKNIDLEKTHTDLGKSPICTSGKSHETCVFWDPTSGKSDLEKNVSDLGKLRKPRDFPPRFPEFPEWPEVLSGG